MLLINTGDGKGKTTAAMGQILRCLGHGGKACVIQLFKNKAFYGEQKMLAKLKNVDFFAYAPKHPGCFNNVTAESVKSACSKALNKAGEILKGRKKYNLLVLEEFNIALRDSFLNIEDLITVLKDNCIGAHILITGRGAPKKLIKLADLVTDMKMIKHPHTKGAKAAKGIEF